MLTRVIVPLAAKNPIGGEETDEDAILGDFDSDVGAIGLDNNCLIICAHGDQLFLIEAGRRTARSVPAG